MRLKTGYEYDNGKTTNQYEGQDFREQIVDAVYRPAGLEYDEGNPLIEALPPPRTEEEIHQAYSVPLPGFFSQLDVRNTLQCLDSMSLIRSARIELPYHGNVEQTIHTILTASYRSRTLRIFRVPFSACEEGAEEKEEVLLTTDSLDTRDNAVRVLGVPGSGKSACISIAKGRYPLAIKHQMDGMEFIQIPLLYVVCPANSNFKELFKSIAREVDRTLGYGKPFHEADFGKTKMSVNEMARRVCDLIEQYSIGALVLDEIQLLNLKSQTAGTDNALLKIINTTGVGLISVGTKDALDRFAGELHLARRLGKLITADAYCENEDYFNMIMTWISLYQWTKKKTKLSDAMLRAMYEETGGIIDMIVSLWLCIQTELIARGGKGGITAKLIRDVSKKYYPGIKDVIAGLKAEDELRQCQYLLLRQKADKSIDEMQAAIRSKEKEAEIVKSFSPEEMQKRAVTKDQAEFMVKSIIDISELNVSASMITDSITAVMTMDEFAGADARTIAEAAMRLLKGEPEEKKPKKKRSRAKAGSKSDLIATRSLRESTGV